jgi:hypothetical protein
MAESVSGKHATAPRVSRATMRKSLLLLNMEYKPSELAAELNITDKTIYQTWLPAGLPFRKDSTGHVWIVGATARAWLEAIPTQSAEKPKISLAPGEAFCLTCRGAVFVSNPAKRRFGRAAVLTGVCPVCGRELRRMLKASELHTSVTGFSTSPQEALQAPQIVTRGINAPGGQK